MTGFGAKNVSVPIAKSGKVLVSLEMKSINSRFFECVCKMPSFLMPLEIKIIKSLKSKLFRGRVYFNLRISEDTDTLEKIIPALKLVEGYIKAIKTIKKKFNLKGDLNISDVLNFRDVFVSDKKQVSKKMEQLILKAVDQVCDNLLKSRAIEGKNLQKDLEKRFSICSEKITKINSLFSKLMKKYTSEIQSYLAVQENGTESDKLKLDELYSVINKIDIHEEITRFNSHLKNIKKVLKEKTPEKGKRIDFILQEILRESNTILAKCSSFDISALAVDIKVELEKAREQAQNIV